MITLLTGQREPLVDALRVPVPLVTVALGREGHGAVSPWCALLGRDGQPLDYVAESRHFTDDNGVLLTRPDDARDAHSFTVDIDGMRPDIWRLGFGYVGAVPTLARLWVRVNNGVTGESLFYHECKPINGYMGMFPVMLYRRELAPNVRQWRIRAMEGAVREQVWPAFGRALAEQL